ARAGAGPVAAVGFGRPWGPAAVPRQVVHAHRDHPTGAGYQLGGTGALGAMAGHPLHLAMIAGLQPPLQMLLMLADIGIGDAQLLEPEFAGDAAYAVGQGGMVVAGGGHGLEYLLD